MHYLYGLTLPGHTNFVYIGVTANPQIRLVDHRRRWRGVRMTLLVAGSRDYIYALEVRAICVFRTSVHDGGANLAIGGAGRQPVRRAIKYRTHQIPIDRQERNVPIAKLRRLLCADAARRK